MRHAGASRPLLGRVLVLGGIIASLLSIAALDWDLARFLESSERARAADRLGVLLGAVVAPDLSRPTLWLGLRLSLDTLSIAIWGTLLGALLGWVLALFASRALVFGLESEPTTIRGRSARFARRTMLELARLALDSLRGVPDFAWAILILTIPGPGPVTGVLAIAVSVAGILGKIYSEHWDSIEQRRLAPALATGSGRTGLLLYLLQPMTSRAMQTYTLMRAECAVRNASVIGAVGGGGLGGQMLEEFSTGNERSALTLLFFLLALTGGADLLTNFMRNRLREDPDHQGSQASSLERSRAARRTALGVCILAALGTALWLRAPLLRSLGEIQRIEWSFIGAYFGGLLRPDLSSQALFSAIAGLPVPLALGWLGTVIGTLLAAGLAWPASVAFQIRPARFTGEHAGSFTRAARATLLVASRAVALVLRAIPEVAWLLVLAALFKVGPLPGVLALSIHSAGVLGRVYVESIDNLPYRSLEPAALGGRAGAFLYAAVPLVRHDWLTYAFFQLDSNVRTGVLLGILGLGGLGNSFHTAFGLAQMGRASTYLIGMVGITIALDRVSRALHFTRGAIS